MNTIWLCALLIIIGVAYYWGYSNGVNQYLAENLSEKSLLELEKYKYDKFYELERWKIERKNEHDVPAP